MTEILIKDQIKKMSELQSIDSEIYNFKKELKEKPAYIQKIKEQFEDNKKKLKELEEKLKALLVGRKTKEVDLQAKEDEIVKANTQLFQLKTNKEYQAKITEIEHLEADKSIVEDKILLSFDEIDESNAKIEKEKSFLAEEEKKFLEQKKEVDEDIKEIRDKLRVLESKRNQITPQIDNAHLRSYERILENRDGVAMVAVQGNSCGGCFMNVPPQVINEIKMHNKLIFCETCNRILYIADDL